MIIIELYTEAPRNVSLRYSSVGSINISCTCIKKNNILARIKLLVREESLIRGMNPLAYIAYLTK